MIKKIINDINRYKSIGILGYGKEGKSFHKFITKYLPQIKIIILDKSYDENYLNNLNKAELIIKSPGISLFNLNINYYDYNFTSPTELFIKHYNKDIIGITGTKGKSTLSTLTYKLLINGKFKNTFLCGNIGIPIFDIITYLNKDSKIILELSSHQLHNIKYSPHISILINMFPEHLDYYKDLNDYYLAKLNIFKYQNDNDIGIFHGNNIPLEIKNKINNKINIENKNIDNYNFQIQENTFINKNIILMLDEIRNILKIPNNILEETINNFKNLPHRLEYCGEINQIKIINDSISTVPETTIEGIEIVKDVNSIILGGYNRGADYKTLVDFLISSDIENIFFISETGKIIFNIFKKFKHSKKIYLLENLKNTMEKALKITKKNHTILFSPASPSFNEYSSFEKRGDYFKEIVSQLN